MQQNEAKVGFDLIKKLETECYIIGDTAYDNNKLYDAAIGKNCRLVAIRRGKNSKGLGHHYQSPARLYSIELLKRKFGQNLIEAKRCIEQMFGQLTNLNCGLKLLPNRVRTVIRVKNWIRKCVLASSEAQNNS